MYLYIHTHGSQYYVYVVLVHTCTFVHAKVLHVSGIALTLSMSSESGDIWRERIRLWEMKGHCVICTNYMYNVHVCSCK